MDSSHCNRIRLLIAVTIMMVLAALLGGLVGCGTDATVQLADVTSTPTRTAQPAATLAPTVTPLPTATPTPVATPTLAPLPENINPLTGEVVSDPSLLNRVPVAIKISNWPPQYVRPQAGISSADLIYEHYNEGWFSTRWTGIFLGKDPGQVGPVRSGRLIDLELPAIYKAVLACWGFSDGVQAIFRDSDLYPNRVASYSLPEVVSPDPFYRDLDIKLDVPMEHTGYTNPANVRAWADAHGISGRQDLRGMLFSETPTISGTSALTLTIPWRDLNAAWRYDEASGRYLRWSDGIPHRDLLTGEQLAVANVVILHVPQWNTEIVEDPWSGALSIQFALWDSNQAVIFRDGVRIDAFWQRWDRWDMLTLTDEAGNTIPLKVGNTFFEVIPTGEQAIEVIVEP